MITDYNLLYMIVFFLSFLQTIAGVGVLVVGTPVLFFFEYTIIEIMYFLLPISIITSLFNLIYFNFLSKKDVIKINFSVKKYFFIFCVSSIFIGILLLKILGNYFDFKILISLFIIFSVLIKNYYQSILINLPKNIKKFFLFLIGIFHGLTNVGGTLLSIFFLIEFKGDKLKSRYAITYFYFFLAFLQYLILFLILENELKLLSITKFFPVILIGIIFGNIITSKLSNKIFIKIIDTLAVISALALIIKL